MTRISREWLVDRIENPNNFTYSDEALEAFKIALQAMDSEPVAYYANDAYYNTRKAAIKDGAEDIVDLYDFSPYKMIGAKCRIPHSWQDSEGDEVMFASEVRDILNSLGVKFQETK